MITILFGLILAGLGGYGLKGPADLHDVAIYPLVFGVLLILLGVAERVVKGKAQEILSYVNSAAGAIGMLLAALMALNTYGSARSEGNDPDMFQIKYLLAMSGTLLVYLNIAVRSLLNARAARKAAEELD